jgi:hypothetical protein
MYENLNLPMHNKISIMDAISHPNHPETDNYFNVFQKKRQNFLAIETKKYSNILKST